MSTNLMILGASARAAAWSARRAGYQIVAADLFADLDTREMGLVRRVDRYPDQLADVARQLSPSAWFYTGGLENHPAIVDRVATWHGLWGNAGDVLRKIRDPFRLRTALRGAGLPCPEIRRDAADIPGDGSWLCKPLQSCGGTRITRVTANWRPDTGRGGRSYFQKFVSGHSYSAVFVGAMGRSQLLAVTRQLAGAPWLGADGYCYAGSLGPVALTPKIRRQWECIGECLSRCFGLQGLFGVDAVQSDGRILPVEVNPRYTASVEVIERATGLRAIVHHANASTLGRLPETTVATDHRCVGKGILYAKKETRISDALRVKLVSIHQGSPQDRVADIPATDQPIGRGRPVVTLLVEAQDLSRAEARLRRLADTVGSLLPVAEGGAPRTSGTRPSDGVG